VWSPLTRSHGGGSKGVTDAAEHAEGSGGHMSQASEYPRAKGVVGEHLMGDPEDPAWPTEEKGLIGVQALQANRVDRYVLGLTTEDGR